MTLLQLLVLLVAKLLITEARPDGAEFQRFLRLPPAKQHHGFSSEGDYIGTWSPRKNSHARSTHTKRGLHRSYANADRSLDTFSTSCLQDMPTGNIFFSTMSDPDEIGSYDIKLPAGAVASIYKLYIELDFDMDRDAELNIEARYGDIAMLANYPVDPDENSCLRVTLTENLTRALNLAGGSERHLSLLFELCSFNNCLLLDSPLTAMLPVGQEMI